jgi:hypothetical protein
MQKHLLSQPLGVCVVGLLMVSLAASGCRPADAPVAPRSEPAGLDQLLRLMEQRLALMHDVAQWKWNAGQHVALSRVGAVQATLVVAAAPGPVGRRRSSAGCISIHPDSNS